MKTRRARTILGIFVLRFAALIVLTLAVLASVSVRASKGGGTEQASRYEAEETAQAMNSRRFPLRDPDAVEHR